MADIFQVVSDQTRRDLLQALLDRYVATDSETGELSVSELVAELGISQPTVSKHLKVLREHGLVHVREEGQHRYYTLDASPLEAVEDWLIPFLSADFGVGDDDPSAVFTAWSGAQLPGALRRATESLPHPGDAGASIGRAVADATHQARSRLEDVSHEVERRVVEPLKKKLKKD